MSQLTLGEKIEAIIKAYNTAYGENIYDDEGELEIEAAHADSIKGPVPGATKVSPSR